MQIKFGTDGWREVISDNFTIDNVRHVAQAMSGYLLSKSGQPLCVVGFDTRFMSDYYAREIAQVLAGNGIKVMITEKAITSPVLSFATKNLSATGGVMVTASHNPPIYNGIKFKGAYGGSALPEVIAEIEEFLFKSPVELASLNDSLIETFNPDEEYLNHLSSIVNLEKILSAGFKIAVDTMYGSSQGYFSKLFEQNTNQILEINNEINPSFGGINPEPIAKNLKDLSLLVKNSPEIKVGLALDGDGDRIGVICSDGSFLNSHQIFALLLMYLVEHRHLDGGIVKTFSTSKMIDALAEIYELPLFETPIGFKYICDLFLTEDILIGGEESGGLGFKNHLPERDGILSGLLLLELLAETGLTPEDLIKNLYQRIGSFYYDRTDLSVNPSAKDKFTELIKNNPPSTFAGYPVTDVKTLDGMKLCLGSVGWVLFRFSGTEPVLRLYAEANHPDKVEDLLKSASALVDNLC